MNLLIEEIWKSEENMEKAYNELLHLSKFDRTKDASKLVNKVMSKVLSPHPVYHDVREWVPNNISDFNLASQILLNQMPGTVKFKTDELEHKVGEWEKALAEKEDGPFAKKAKFKDEQDPDAGPFNEKLAGIRNLKILKNWIGMNSFRLSPIGSTPALADLNNLSSLSIQSLTPYCYEGTQIKLINHEAIAKHINLTQQEDGGFVADGLMYPVYSKSGGDIVTRAITSRWITYSLLISSSSLHVLPKYDSLLINGEYPHSFEEFILDFKG